MVLNGVGAGEDECDDPEEVVPDMDELPCDGDADLDGGVMDRFCPVEEEDASPDGEVVDREGLDGDDEAELGGDIAVDGGADGDDEAELGGDIAVDGGADGDDGAELGGDIAVDGGADGDDVNGPDPGGDPGATGAAVVADGASEALSWGAVKPAEGLSWPGDGGLVPDGSRIVCFSDASPEANGTAESDGCCCTS